MVNLVCLYSYIILRMLHKRNDVKILLVVVVCVLVCVCQHESLEIYTSCCVGQKFAPCYCWIVFHGLDIPQVVYHGAYWPSSGLIPVLRYCEQNSYEHLCAGLRVFINFYLSGISVWNVITGCTIVTGWVLLKTTKLLSWAVVPFYITTNKVWVIQVLYIFTRIWCQHYFLLLL